MEQPTHRYGLQFLLYVLFSGVMFALPYSLATNVEWFATRLANVSSSWYVYLILGNISSIGFAIIAGIAERVTRIEKEVLDRHQDR